MPCIIAAVAALCVACTGAGGSGSAAAAGDGPAAIGTVATSPAELRSTLSDMGRRSVQWNVSYMRDTDRLPVDLLDASAAAGVTHHVITLEIGSLQEGTDVLRQIAGGAVDDNLLRIAREMNAWHRAHPGSEIIVRPLHEANLDSGPYPWGFAAGDGHVNLPQDFSRAWDRIWRVMRKGFSDLKFFLCPNGDLPPYNWGVPSSEVDYIGDDNYNWSESSGQWRTPADVHTATVKALRAVYPDKPYVIAETATSDPGDGVVGHSKAEWFRLLAEWMKGPAARLGVVAVCYFDHPPAPGARNDWRIYSPGSPGAEQNRHAFQAAFRGMP